MAINYSFDESLVTKQNAAEKAMLEEFHAGNYTFENPFVKLNPYLINPLAAVVMFKTEEEVAVTREETRRSSILDDDMEIPTFLRRRR